MNLRIIFGRFLIRLGRFIKSLAVSVMKPDDFIELSRQMYVRSETVNIWGEEEWLRQGLSAEEKALLEKIPFKEGQLLLLGLGGGREAIQLVRMGFDVTGIDFIPKMVQKARENALREGISIEGLVQEFSALDLPECMYHIIWISEVMYSCIPTSKKRIAMLKKIGKSLKPGGCFVCQCSYSPQKESRKGVFIRKVFAFLTLGNFWYERGDRILNTREFVHFFTSEDEFRAEVEEGGFEIAYIHIPQNQKEWSGQAILKTR
ncbi:MAG: class I SAM-dependent methyltransferase [bacterium]|nr:class I SAM-dependent methyltransferase [bacterium]